MKDKINHLMNHHRVALIVCGQYRKSVEDATASIVENLIKPNKIDVYISTWEFGINSVTRSPFQTESEKIRTSVDMFKYPNIVDFIQSKEINLASFIHPSRIEKGSNHHPWSIVYNNHLISKALESIKASNTHYDVICKVRPDLTIHTKLIIDKNHYLNLSHNVTAENCASDKLYYCTYDTFFEFVKNLKEGAEVLKKRINKNIHWNDHPVGERFYRQTINKMNIRTTIIDGKHGLLR